MHVGHARVDEAQEALRYMTTTMHIEYPAAGGYQHATAMVGSISFPEMKVWYILQPIPLVLRIWKSKVDLCKFHPKVSFRGNRLKRTL